LVSIAALAGMSPWIGFRYDRFERAMPKAMREVAPESLAPKTPETRIWNRRAGGCPPRPPGRSNSPDFSAKRVARI
jgi:hypothetical protein